jgi:hypothetical protein
MVHQSCTRRVPALVRVALARRLDCDVSRIHPWQDLEVDLDLTPLELILVALDIEEIEGVDLPVEALGSVRTVGDLFSFFSHAMARRPASSTPEAP